MAVFLFVTACCGPARRARGPGRPGHMPRSDRTQRRSMQLPLRHQSPRNALRRSSMNGRGYACGKEVNLGKMIEP